MSIIEFVVIATQKDMHMKNSHQVLCYVNENYGVMEKCIIIF